MLKAVPMDSSYPKTVYMKELGGLTWKIGKIAIFLRSGLKKTWFFAILGIFWGQKFFLMPESCFQPILHLEMMFSEKNFSTKNDPKKWQNYGFFLGTLY